MASDILHATYGKVILQGGSRQTMVDPQAKTTATTFPIVAPKLLLLRDAGGGAANVGVWQIWQVLYWFFNKDPFSGLLYSQNGRG